MTDRDTVLRRAKQYALFLGEEGYPVQEKSWETAGKENDDPFFVFKANGLTLLCTCDYDDEPFVRLILPNFWSLGDEGPHAVLAACLAASAANRQAKCAKVALDDEANPTDVTASVEFLDPSDGVSNKPQLLRYLGMLQGVGNQFRTEFRTHQSALADAQQRDKH